MRRFTLRRVITARERLPRFYGVAWYQDFSLFIVCYPLGLHWVAQIVREVWWAMHGPGFLARRDAEMREHWRREGWTACERLYQGRVNEVLNDLVKLNRGEITASEILVQRHLR